MHPPKMLKKGQEISYKQFDKEEEEEVEPKTSLGKTILMGTLVLAFTALISTLVFIAISSGYLLSKHKGRIITSREWKDSDPDDTGDYLTHPVSNVIILHSKTESCDTEEVCTNFMKNNKDIDSNFYIGGDGNVYEGTGWDLVVQTVDIDLSNTSVTITFIGTYITVLPNDDQLQAGRQLLVMGVTMGKISINYQLLPDPQSSITDDPQLDFLKMLNTTQEEPSILNV